jgi:hypothetical protein
LVLHRNACLCYIPDGRWLNGSNQIEAYYKLDSFMSSLENIDQTALVTPAVALLAGGSTTAAGTGGSSRQLVKTQNIDQTTLLT